MASPLSEDVMELPQDIVRASPGFAFDIGSSVAKIVYRSKKDYKNGIPLQTEGDPKTGRVHLAMFPRENTDDVIAFIDENCDFTRDEEGLAHISATGVGGSQFKSKIEEKLKIKIKVLPEFDCFIKTFKKVSSTLTKEHLLYPIPEKGKAGGELMASFTKDFFEKGEGMIEGKLVVCEEEEADRREVVEESEESMFPCMVVMAGSGTAIMMVNKDGSYNIVDSIYMGGRSFLGMVSLSTGVKDFKKMMKMAAESDGRTATIFMSDFLPAESPKEGDEKDVYSNMAGEKDVPLLPLGKVHSAERENVKDGDVIQAMYYLLGNMHAQVVELQCIIHKVKTAYFCGNFTDNEVARNNIIFANVARKPLSSSSVDMQFLRHGGMYGALGAFIKSAET